MQNIRHESQTSPSLAVSNLLYHYRLPLRWLYLSKNLFEQFLSQHHLRQIRFVYCDDQGAS